MVSTVLRMDKNLHKHFPNSWKLTNDDGWVQSLLYHIVRHWVTAEWTRDMIHQALSLLMYSLGGGRRGGEGNLVDGTKRCITSSELAFILLYKPLVFLMNTFIGDEFHLHRQESPQCWNVRIFEHSALMEYKQHVVFLDHERLFWLSEFHSTVHRRLKFHRRRYCRLSRSVQVARPNNLLHKHGCISRHFFLDLLRNENNSSPKMIQPPRWCWIEDQRVEDLVKT